MSRRPLKKRALSRKIPISRSALRREKTVPGALPSRDEVLAFLSGGPAPNGLKPPPRVTKRNVARAFGVKGDKKSELKPLIKDLEVDGAITRGRKVFYRPRAKMPEIGVHRLAAGDDEHHCAENQQGFARAGVD